MEKRNYHKKIISQIPIFISQVVHKIFTNQ